MCLPWQYSRWMGDKEVEYALSCNATLLCRCSCSIVCILIWHYDTVLTCRVCRLVYCVINNHSPIPTNYPGVTVPYTSDKSLAAEPLIGECNSQCNCISEYDPVCMIKSNGEPLQFTSICHAGCRQANKLDDNVRVLVVRGRGVCFMGVLYVATL
jgi:hypothetical protein